MLVAVDSSNNNLHNGHCEIQTFDLTTQKWSHLLETPLGHRMPSIDCKYLYFLTGNIDPQSDADPLLRSQSRGDWEPERLSPIEEEISETSWIGVTAGGDPLLTCDIGTDEIYHISLRWH